MARAAVLTILVTVLLASAASLQAKTGEAPKPPSGPVLRKLAKPPTRPALASERIYYVLTDRYADGTMANNAGGLTGGRSVTGYDPADPRYFHGGDFRGLTGSCTDTTRGLARVKQLGFTAVWVSPPFGQRQVQVDSAAYHGNWPRDFTAVDPHLGTDADFAAFVRCAHSLGLKVLLEAVVNHTADYISLPASTRYAAAPFRDCRGATFDPSRFVRAGFPCLRPANMPKPPTVPAADAQAKKPAWLNDVTKYHDRGDIPRSCSDSCFEQGDDAGLDDLFTEQPAVWQGLAGIYANWVRRYRLDGLAVDGVRRVNAAFFGLWAPRVSAAARAAGVRDFQIVGDADVADPVALSAYVRRRGLPNVLDVPLQDALVRYAAGAGEPRRVGIRLEQDDYFEQGGVLAAPATFLGNRAIGRAAAQILLRSAPTISDADFLKRVLLGYDLMYLLRGAPVVMYGDEAGITGPGGGDAASQDMSPTQVPAWTVEKRVGSPAIGIGSSFDRGAHPIAQRLRQLSALRDAARGLSTGATFVRFARGGVLAVSRIDAAERREYLAVFNASSNPARVDIPTSTPSSGWAALLGAATSRSDSRGRVELPVPGLSSLLLRADVPLPQRPVTPPKVRLAPDNATGYWQVSAGVGSAGPVTVSFAVRPARGTSWLRFGADDSAPYRAFLDPGSFKRGAEVYLVAIVRSLDGRTAVSRVTPLRPRG